MGATHIQNRTKRGRGNEFSVALKAFGAVAIYISWPAGLCVGIALLCIIPSDTMSHWGGGRRLSVGVGRMFSCLSSGLEAEI